LAIRGGPSSVRLDYSGADQISEEPRRFELRACLSEIVLTLSPMWRRLGHQVTIDCPDIIVMDGYSGVISQIITNLITNSLVHGYDEGAVGNISIKVDNNCDNDFELIVCNDGERISHELKSRVFEPFSRRREAQEA